MASLPETDLPPAGPAARLLPRFLARWQRQGAALSALAVRLGAAGLAYLLQIVLARSLGAAEYGTFSLVWNLVTIGGFLATLGFGQIAVRFMAQYQAEGRADLAHGFLRLGMATSTFGATLFAALGFAFFPLAGPACGGIGCLTLALALATLPFFALADFAEGVARSQGWTFRALVPPYLVRQGLLILLLLGLVTTGTGIEAGNAMMAAFAATALAAALQAALLAPAILRLFPAAPPRFALGEWRRAALPMLLSDLAVLARQNIDLILLALLAPPAMVGLYFAATRIASLFGLIEFALGAAFGHQFARQAGKSDPAAFEALYAETRRLTFWPGLLAAGALMLATPLILRLFGPDFAGATLPAQILIAAAALRLATGPAEDALAMAGHPGTVWRGQCAGALLTAWLCLLLAGPWQATGAALAAAAGSLLTTGWLALGLRRHLGFLPFAARRQDSGR